jgi:hypothetical protein
VSATQAFLWGFGGSCAIELVTAFQLYHAPKIVFPPRYRRKMFWVIRFAIAVLAGILAVAYDIDQPLLAINVGAATPLIIQTLGATPPRVEASPTQNSIPQN